MILLDAITKSYFMGHEVQALKQVNLCFPDGDFSAIIGASGSGKSTLLHVMGLIHRPTTGRVVYNGVDTVNMDDDQRARFRGQRVGFVFQSFHLVPHLSVLENTELPLFYQRVPPEERKARAIAALERVQMTHRMDHMPNQLSGGECQRTAIARAIVADPDIIYADEPTGALDVKTGNRIFDIFHELHASGKTIVMITHDEKIAARVPRNVRLSDGLIVEDVTR